MSANVAHDTWMFFAERRIIFMKKIDKNHINELKRQYEEQNCALNYSGFIHYTDYTDYGDLYSEYYDYDDPD